MFHFVAEGIVSLLIAMFIAFLCIALQYSKAAREGFLGYGETLGSLILLQSLASV